MHILHVLPHVRDVGDGIANATVDLACEQSRLGHVVAVASGGGEFEWLLATHEVEHHKLEVTRDPRRLMEVRRQMRSVLDSVGPDVAHAHTLTSAATIRLSRMLLRPPLVTTIHTEFYRSTPLMALGDRVIAPSHAVATAVRRRGIPQKKIRVVLNGTLGGPRATDHGTRAPESLAHPAVVSVAGMYRRKGIDDLIGAFASVASRLSTSHLYLVGDGPDRAQFEIEARRTGLSDRIHFAGYKPDPFGYLLAADLFVLASHRDPCPLVIAEAREAGCPILASDADGIPELLESGRAGRLFPPGDRQSMAREMERFLTDEDYRRTWRVAAKENIAWLTTDRVARDTVAVYEELLSHRGSGRGVRRPGPGSRAP